MTKAQKRMGETKRSVARRMPLVEPTKPVGTRATAKARPFVLVEVIDLVFAKRPWRLKHRYATAQARQQARAKFERTSWRKDRTTYEEYEE